MENVTLLDAVGATGSGVEKSLDEVLKSKYELRTFNMPIQVSGITSATVILEGSMDGTTWSAISGSTFTVDACATLNVPFPFVRANCTVFATGTITVVLGI